MNIANDSQQYSTERGGVRAGCAVGFLVCSRLFHVMQRGQVRQLPSVELKVHSSFDLKPVLARTTGTARTGHSRLRSKMPVCTAPFTVNGFSDIRARQRVVSTPIRPSGEVMKALPKPAKNQCDAQIWRQTA